MNYTDLNMQMRRFENTTNYLLPDQSYTIVRLDIENFREVKEKLDKPFDDVFSAVMVETMSDLAKKVEGCIYAYTNNNEILLILHNDRNTTPYYGNKLQKIVSSMSSMASSYFIKTLYGILLNYQKVVSEATANISDDNKTIIYNRISTLASIIDTCVIFSCKIFTIPEDECWNVVYWRQRLQYINTFNNFAISKLGIEKVRELRKFKDIANEFKSNGVDFEKDIPEKYLFGLQAIKVKKEDGSLVWEVTTAPKMQYDEIL